MIVFPYNLAPALLLGLCFAASALADHAPVDLGLAGNFSILAKSGISSTGTTSVGGDVGISPAAASYITGFGLIRDSTGTFSTSAQVTGKVYAADYTEPTPTDLTAAVSAMQTAYTNAAGRTPPDFSELKAGDIRDTTLAPGLYKWTSVVTINGSLVLEGGADDVWIFQISQTLSVGSNAVVSLNGGALPHNIFWQVAGQTTLGTYSSFTGTILDATAVVVQTGAFLSGRALAQTAVTLDAATLPLAADLSLFTCRSGDDGIALFWRTASESDNYEWLIERSCFSDGLFQHIATINALGGSPTGRSYSYTDSDVLPITIYYYRLGDKNISGQVTWHGPIAALSNGPAWGRMQLMSIRPNPASGNVYINYSLPRAGLVLLSVYDIRGRQVKTLVRDHKQGGEYKLIWTGDDSRGNPLPSSVYFYRLYYEGTRLTKRMVLLR